HRARTAAPRRRAHVARHQAGSTPCPAADTTRAGWAGLRGGTAAAHAGRGRRLLRNADRASAASWLRRPRARPLSQRMEAQQKRKQTKPRRTNAARTALYRTIFEVRAKLTEIR